MKPLHREAKPSTGYQLAAARMSSMSIDELAALTAGRLVTSYGVRPDEADRLLKGFTRRNR